ncbi:unnamed protein product [Owenia fusiformis]|uniref:Fatty acid 2-hydroxylase n=1 Tax=Owenia fusiformis TaxID=6347 RepID=A0A8J1UQN6_OWEFU|nr:unnamed protein product [Owenia fusiformis]
MPVFSLHEVKKHCKDNDLWVVHQDKVYDVSEFVERHPGGKDIVLENSGVDVTTIMETTPHKHSDAAYTILKKYYIGDIKTIQTNGKNAQKRISTKDEPKKMAANGNGATNNGIHENKENQFDFIEKDFIDWDKPILWQVHKLGRHYEQWVHTPQETCIRLFKSDFCEYFSKTAWYLIPMFWLPVMSMFLYKSYSEFQGGSEQWPIVLFGGFSFNAYSIPVFFAFGALFWTFLEYVVHRWLFHMIPDEKSPFLITLHFILHGQHHKSPFDRERLVFPIVPGVIFACLFNVIYTFLFPYSIKMAVLAGTILGYVSYDLTHYYLHHGSIKFDYFKRLKNYHVRHHFEHQRLGFGISSKLWDYPFGTLIPEKQQ